MAAYYGIISRIKPRRPPKTQQPGRKRRRAQQKLQIRFPDIPGCIAKATSLDELDELAQKALSESLTTLHLTGSPMPAPSAYADIRRTHHRDRGFLGLTRVIASPVTRSIRINMSVGESDLIFIDELSRALGLDRSTLVSYALHQFRDEWVSTGK